MNVGGIEYPMDPIEAIRLAMALYQTARAAGVYARLGHDDVHNDLTSTLRLRGDESASKE
jgi:hypothetical protein